MPIFRNILIALGLAEPTADPGALVPRVVVKIVDTIAVNLGQGETLSLSDLAAKAGVPTTDPYVTAIVNLLGGNVLRRDFDSVAPADLQALVSGAKEQDPTYAPPEFENFLEIVCPLGFDSDSLAAAFGQWVGVVEYAYTAATPSDPVTPTITQVVGTTNFLFPQQKYLAAAPDGIDAPAAWAKGATGGGSNFFDLEQGWFLGHEDLPIGIPKFGGANRVSSGAHGTAVLGEIIAMDNTIGIVGIAPGARPSVISYTDPADPQNNNLAPRVEDRIVAASSRLMFGDVLLIEVQTTGMLAGQADTLLPVEIEPAIFEATRLATKFGVIVVEPAGNNHADLDLFTDTNSRHVLSRGSADFKDSGAIMVGACVSGVPHSQWHGTNYGTRIDCYAWGEDIVTCAWDRSNPKIINRYWGVNFGPRTASAGFAGFGGTSGAAPIIAGCCLLLQDLRSELTPISGTGNLSPINMREILSDPANGTASFEVTDQIGSMPDLAKIIANEFV
jgi:Subtilase family